MAYTTLEFTIASGVARLTFDRPERLNAFNEDMSHELVDVMAEIEGHDDVRVVVISGRAGNFMGGADIGMLKEWSTLEREELKQRLLDGFSPSMLERLPQPVVAGVDGFALGMGCEISLACDFRIATRRAQFGLPEITLGLIPGAGGSQRLPHLIGRTRAAGVVMLGERIDAPAGADMGLVNRVVEPEALDDAVEATVAALVAKSPLALARAKRCLVTSSDEELYDGVAFELESFADTVLTEDAAEGTAAFLEKRVPSFKGR